MGDVRIGFLTEGHDHLLLEALLTRLLEIDDNRIEKDLMGGTSGCGWKFVLENVPHALRRFYHMRMMAAVIGVDNDGNLDLDVAQPGANGKMPLEDPVHPRHWNHPGECCASCRYCQLDRMAQSACAQLNWRPDAKGADWPVLIAVPVEMIEAWVLAAQAILDKNPHRHEFERKLRHTLKRRLYGRPAASERDVTDVALPVLRRLDSQSLVLLKDASKSFALWADQVESQRNRILGLAQ